MSESTGEKTEQPTAKRLRDARKKGQIAKSKEIVSAAGIAVCFTVIIFAKTFFIESFKQLIQLPFKYYHLPFRDAMYYVVKGVVIQFIILSTPLIAAVIVSVVMSNILQFGVIFSFDPVKPNLDHLNPVAGFKKIFSMQNVLELLKSVVKIIFLGVLIWLVIRDAIPELMKLPTLKAAGVLMVLSKIMFKVAIYTMFAYFIIALLDHFFQKYLHIRKNKMTKDEVKREFKEMEGDPIIKGQRRQLHQEMAMNAMMQKVKKAKVVVTNPTHLAVALYYEKDETALPIVLAKGKNLIAKQIVGIARKEGIPIMQNIPLAHSLYEQVDLERYIPSDLIKPVAEVLKWVQRLERRAVDQA